MAQQKSETPTIKCVAKVFKKINLKLECFCIEIREERKNLFIKISSIKIKISSLSLSFSYL